MMITRKNSREPDDDGGTSSIVTEAQVDAFLHRVLDVQRRFFYETDRRLQADRRAELRKHARIILGAEKQGIK